jgi:hypothetical protein
MADHGEPLVAEGVHQRDPVAGEGAGVVPVLGLVGQPDQFSGQPFTSSSGGPLAADDRVQAQLTGVDVPARERIGETGRKVGTPETEPGPSGVGSGADDELRRISFRKDRSNTVL